MFQIGRILSRLASLAMMLGTICIVLMMLHVTADVTSRYLLNKPLPGTLVIVAHFYMVIIVFAGLGVAEEKDAHISVEVVTDIFSKKFHISVALLTGAVSTLAFGLLAVRGYKEAVSKTKIGAVIEQGSDLISVWPSYWALPVGAGLMALIAFYKLAVALSGSRNGLRAKADGMEEHHE